MLKAPGLHITETFQAYKFENLNIFCERMNR